MHPPYPALSILCGHAFVDFIDYMYSAKDAFGSPDVIEDALKIVSVAQIRSNDKN